MAAQTENVSREDVRAHKSAKGKFTSRETSEKIYSPLQEIAVLLESKDSDGRITAFEIAAEPGAASGPHEPFRENAYIFVVDGQWEITAGGDTRTLGKYSAVLAPKSAPCQYRLVGDKSGKLFVFYLPAVR